MANRKNRLSLPLTDEETAKLEALASDASMSPASWLRTTIVAQYSDKFGRPPPRTPKREKKLLGT